MKFNNLLDVHGLKQHVNEPTHMLGHTLDLFIAQDSSRLLCTAVAVVDPSLTDPSGNYSGDHFALVAPLNLIKPSRQRKTVTFRKYTSINLTEFKTDIRTALSACLPHEDAASLVELYAHACSDIIDLHAPLINKVVTIRPDTAWYTKELWLVKTLRRELERCWRKTGLAIHRAIYKDQCGVAGRLIWDTKKNYYERVLNERPSNQSKLFNLSRRLFGLNQVFF